MDLLKLVATNITAYNRDVGTLNQGYLVVIVPNIITDVEIQTSLVAHITVATNYSSHKREVLIKWMHGRLQTPFVILSNGYGIEPSQ